MNRISKILLSPFFLALVLSAILIPFLPLQYKKYTFQVTDKGSIARSMRTAVFYEDLDGDGNSDKIISDSNFAYHSIRVIDHNNGTWDQENFNGVIPKKQMRLFFGDQDEDGFHEIYVFTQREDSLFLHAVETMDSLSAIHFRDKFLTTLTKRQGRYEYTTREQHFIDLTGDSVKDLLLSVEGEFSLQPRKWYLLDLKKDTIWESPVSGSIPEMLWFADLNQDGTTEFTGSMSGAGNIHDSLNIPCHDYSAWLMCYTAGLTYLFPPIEFHGFRSEVYTTPYYEGNRCRILLLYNNIGSLKNEPALSIHDEAGKVLSSRKLVDQSKIARRVITEKLHDSLYHYFLIEGSGKIYTIETDLSLKLHEHLAVNINPSPYLIDLDGDGLNEKVFTVPNATLARVIITRNDFSFPVDLTFPSQITSTSYVSIIDRMGEKRKFYVMNGDLFTEYQYGKNPLYSLRLLIYAGIYLVLLLFILLIMKLQRIRLKKQHEQFNRMLELQLKSLNNQLDPHFTFNAFNSIAGIIQEGDRDEAYRSFTKFAGLIRSNLESSNKISRTLKEELQFVMNYLDLQKLRFKDQLNHEIHVSGDVNMDRLIPKMLIQIYVENAIKHGLRHKQGQKSLKISVDRKDKQQVVTIEDNGIGREASRAHAGESTGLGLLLMEQFYELYKEYYKIRISHEIIDLHDATTGEPSGTRVVIHIPELR